MRRPVALLLSGLTLTTGALAVAAPASADAVRDAQWYLKPLGVEQAWETTRGAGVTVCVIDSGVDDQVPDLRGAVVGAKTFANYTNADGLVSAHGTGVAAALAGRGHDGSAGVIGVAPQARLLSAVVDEFDVPDIGRQVSAALHWCTDQGAKVVNLSIQEKADDGMSAAVAYAQSRDVVVVAASGNTFSAVSPAGPLPYPAVIPGVVAVTGINRTLLHDGGAIVSTTGKPVSLSAPFSTTDATNGNPEIGLPAALDRHAPADARYDLRASGTSYSSPIVAGAAALVRAAHPSMSANDVINALVSTATPAGSGRTDRTYGYGILNVARAVGADLPHVSANPLLSPPVAARPTATARPSATATPTTSSTSAAGATSAPTSTPAAVPRSDNASSGLSGGVLGGLLAGLVLVGAVLGGRAVRRRRSTAA